jgi:hypothetical protein
MEYPVEVEDIWEHIRRMNAVERVTEMTLIGQQVRLLQEQDRKAGEKHRSAELDRLGTIWSILQYVQMKG